MTAIKSNFGEGGANLAPNGAGDPTLAESLRDIADDLGDRAAVTSPDASDLATAITLLNEIKGLLTGTLRTTKA